MKAVSALALLALLAMPVASAEELPYSTRSRPFTGWSSTARGDIRTVGMAGATVGLADTFLATGSNPAGLAMTLGGADLTFASNTVHDSHIQSFEETIASNSYGTALSGYPWGIGFGYRSPYGEGAPYTVGGTPVLPKISTRMAELSIARVFENTVSLGVGISLGQGEIEIDDTRGNSSAYHSYAVGANFGIMFQLPNRFLLAGSHSTPMKFSAATADNPSPIIAGFYQPIEMPSRSTLGLGWIPNRFFRADFDLAYIGSTPTTALIRDETALVGENGVYIPRLGAAYTFIDYKELHGTVFGGTYFETAREESTSNRIHVTSGIEIKPWVLTIG
ncbi:MAG TPA: hypothetical protein VM598_10910, partial [Bdellovibrionota bacterium]|nr:hypothetical protein [Bdellovibrionota bacterium]